MLSALFCLWVNSLQDETLLKLLASIQGSFQGFIPGHSMARANLNKSEWLVTNIQVYYRSIEEAQNLHQLKSPLSDLTS